jgi:hypothetical protein
MAIMVKRVVDWEEHWDDFNEESYLLSGTVELTNGKRLNANLFCESDDGIDMHRGYGSDNEQVWDGDREIGDLGEFFDIDDEAGCKLWKDIFDALWHEYEKSLEHKDYSAYSDKIFQFDDLLERTNGYIASRCYYLTTKNDKCFCVKKYWESDRFEFAEITKEQYDAIDNSWNPSNDAVFHLIEDMGLEFKKCRVN